MDEDKQPKETNGSRLLRNPFDLGLVISIVGLLLTITVNVVTMYERVTRIETQMESVRQSLVQNEQIADTVHDNQGELRVLGYRIERLERGLDRDGDAN